MSRANKNHDRLKDDHYVTPLGTITDFFDAYPAIISCKFRYFDPCAGGLAGSYSMPYPEVLIQGRMIPSGQVRTMDIRGDSPAEFTGDYLGTDISQRKSLAKPDVIISNPPFKHAREFIEKALHDVIPGGRVAFLLRLSFLESQKRRDWWRGGYMPSYIFVHSRRPAFDPRRPKGTDAAAYGHFVWVKNVDGSLANVCRGLEVI